MVVVAKEKESDLFIGRAPFRSSGFQMGDVIFRRKSAKSTDQSRRVRGRRMMSCVRMMMMRACISQLPGPDLSLAERAAGRSIGRSEGRLEGRDGDVAPVEHLGVRPFGVHLGVRVDEGRDVGREAKVERGVVGRRKRGGTGWHAVGRRVGGIGHREQGRVGLGRRRRREEARVARDGLGRPHDLAIVLQYRRRQLRTQKSAGAIMKAPADGPGC